MASELTVQTIKGPTSGGNANKILIPSTDKIIQQGNIVNITYGTHNTTGLTHSSDAWVQYTGSNITVTKKLGAGNVSGGSYMLIIGHTWIEYSASANQKHLSYSLMRDGNELTGQAYGLGNLYSNSAGGYQSSADISFVDTGNYAAGSSHTYSMALRANNSSTVQMGNGSRVGTWQILEFVT